MSGIIVKIRSACKKRCYAGPAPRRISRKKFLAVEISFLDVLDNFLMVYLNFNNKFETLVKNGTV